MARPKSDNVQINISIPSEWKKELENLARIYSVEEGETITFLDLMRRGIQEKYQLGEKNELLSGKLNDAPSGRLFRADLEFLQRCPSL